MTPQLHLNAPVVQLKCLQIAETVFCQPRQGCIEYIMLCQAVSLPQHNNGFDRKDIKMRKTRGVPTTLEYTSCDPHSELQDLL